MNTASELKVGDVIEEEDLGTLSFDGIEFTDELLSSDTSGIYNRLKVEYETNTYLVAKFTLTNYKSEAVIRELPALIFMQRRRASNATGGV